MLTMYWLGVQAAYPWSVRAHPDDASRGPKVRAEWFAERQDGRVSKMNSCRRVTSIVAWYVLLLQRAWQSQALQHQAVLVSEAHEGNGPFWVPRSQWTILGPTTDHDVTQTGARQLLTTACPAAGAPLDRKSAHDSLPPSPSPPQLYPALATQWITVLFTSDCFLMPHSGCHSNGAPRDICRGMNHLL